MTTIGFQKGYTPWNKGLKLSAETRQKMKGRVPWNKGRIGLIFPKKGKVSNCKICKKEIYVYPHLQNIRRFCSYKCASKGRRSEGKRANWKGGQALKKNLWIVFSRYIRQRDGGTCISCGKRDNWKKMDAGHYIPKTAGLSLYFDERNVNCQCTYCNRWMHGNLSRYAVALMKKYGDKILEELDVKRKETRQVSTKEYQDLIEQYKSKLKELEGTKL